MRKTLGLLCVLGAVLASAAACGGGGGGDGGTTTAAGGAAGERGQTLYTTGTQWGPYSDLNPFKNWDYVTGTVGLVYETPFRYDPLADEFIPWLAESGEWQGESRYVMTVRDGVEWSDGEPLTAADFAFTYETLKLEAHPQHTLWTTGLERVSTDGRDVVFEFSGTPNYQEWDNYLFNVPIVPEHVWRDYTEQQIVSGNLSDTSKLVGTGPYAYEAGLDSTVTFTWRKRDGWWATDALGLEVAPEKIVDIYNGSNAASLANLLAGKIDISNNFVPGIQKHVGGEVDTYYDREPYMLSANTAWLFPNTTRKPLDDPQFRRALAHAIDVDRIVSADYGGIVTKANPTGLLPIWDEYVDRDLVDELGFAYDVAEAKRLLADAGYRDTDGDGMVENRDGSRIDLGIAVPNGWSDWMTAIQIVAESAKEAGIRITPSYPDYNTLVDDRGHGRFDLVIANDRQISNTPWTYYDYLFRLPVQENQTTVNYGRYENERAWELTQQLDRTPTDDEDAMRATISELQEIFLRDLPAIPLWYNGLWAQWNPSQWTSWPSDEGEGQQNLPAMWRNYLQMTGIDMLTRLEPAGG